MRLTNLARLALLGTAAALAACSQMSSSSHVAASGDLRQHLFDDHWLFAKDDLKGAESPAFDDHAWRTLDLPHDWSIEGPFDPNLASGTGFLPAGIAWYRKHFTLSPDDYGKIITIRFDGVYKHSTVYLNGQKLGDRPYGYSSFEYRLNPYNSGNLKFNGDNVLAVRVDHHDFADSRWYPGSGVYRNVYLTVTSPIHVAHDGVCVTTSDVADKSAVINIQTAIRDEHPAMSLLDRRSIDLETIVYDQEGRKVADVPQSNLQILSGDNSASQRVSIPSPALWSVDHPALYTAVTELRENGTLLDTYRTPFGIRTAKFDPNTGFWLNGVNMKIKGVCLHEDAGALGSAIPQQVWERRLRILKEAGTNAIRCSHNPPAPEFLDLCDRLGFLVMDEAFDEWNCPTYTGPQGKKKWVDSWSGTVYKLDGYHSDFDQWADTDIKDMVRRDRNHPSIIMWSIGNEIDYPNDPYPPNNPDLVPVARRLIADVKSLDTTRPVTAACASIATNLWYKYLDIVGYNYQESRYTADHAAMPNMVIFGSENDIKRLGDWLAVKNNPFISSQFLWTGIDYLGEAGRPAPNKAWPERSRPDGFLDLAAFKKPMFYYRQSLWTDEPMVKIDANLPEENQTTHRMSIPPGLACYTNCDSVEFFQNGKSLGERLLPAATHVIAVPGDPAAGPIKAVAKKNGKSAAQDTFTQPGPAAKIALSRYKSILGPGDGPNVAQIELSLLDASGNWSRSADNQIDVKIDGPGRLLGIESGDNNSHENYQAPTHKTYMGRLLIYVETHGPVAVTTSSQGLPPATIRAGG